MFPVMTSCIHCGTATEISAATAEFPRLATTAADTISGTQRGARSVAGMPLVHRRINATDAREVFENNGNADCFHIQCILFMMNTSLINNHC